MRAIAYFKLENSSLGNLSDIESEFNEFCKYEMHQPFRTFFSEGAIRGITDPDFQRMVDFMVESGSEFLVVVPDATHLGQEIDDVVRSVVRLDSVGATVRCWDDDLPDPLQSALGLLGIRGVSKTRSKRIKESMERRALEGKALGKPPFGYHIGNSGSLDVVPEEASVVELIFRLYTRDSLGFRRIAQELNERDISTRRGGQWNVVSVRDIVKNNSYTGTYERYGMRRPNAHQSIIPPDVFREAQDKLRSRKPFGRVANVEPFLLSGLVYCGECGNKMTGVTRRQSWRLKDGSRKTGVYRYYQCQSRVNRSVCSYHTKQETELESTALTKFKLEILSRVAGLGQDLNTPNREGDLDALRQTRVENAKRRFIRSVRRAASGELGIVTLGKYLTDLDDARKLAQNVASPEDVVSTLDSWSTLSIQERRDFLTQHVLKIEVTDSSVEVLV